MLKPGVLDVQGQAVEGVLRREGLPAESVRVGRRVEVTVAADDVAGGRQMVERMATTLLANPVLEEFTIETIEAPVEAP